MKHKTVRFGLGFKVLLGNPRVQAAQMVMSPGDSEGGPQNRHQGSDQWLFVIQGTGTALINGRRHRLRCHSLILIEHGDKHEIRNTGRTVLKTLNFYSPPGYSKSGNELPAARVTSRRQATPR
jgi:mannose-6-phosphate isomerase-like protein (cupin superfamily)